MKLPQFTPGKKLQATVRRVRAGVAERAALSRKAEEDYDEEDEPSTKLSSAFMVVFLLHVTAIGGVWAFGNIKAHRAGTEVVANPAANVAVAAPKTAIPDRPLRPEASEVKSTEARQATGTSPTHTAASTRKESEETPVRAGQGVYTTVRGDNPVTIAHHFGVSYDDLLKLNNIEDPKRLQIGQKLRIPAKRTESKQTERASNG